MTPHQKQSEPLAEDVFLCDLPDDALEAAAAPANGVPTLMHTYCFTCPAGGRTYAAQSSSPSSALAACRSALSNPSVKAP
jgi:hypothetical protein